MSDEMLQEQDISLEALKAGDRSEFAKMVDFFSARIYRLGLKMLNNPQDAEDMLQETFIKAFRHLGSFDGRARLSTWLYRIAANEALMMLRKRQPDMVSINEPFEAGEQDPEPLQIVDWCCIPEDELLSAEGRAQLDRAMQNLPYPMRMVFLLRDVEDLSTRETAEILDLTETAVKTRLSRARLRLREDLSSYYKGQIEGRNHAR